MEFTTIPGKQVSTPPAAQTTPQGSSLASLSDFNSFLKLFITQLKYQDPLSPTSQEDFLAQTAQFSSVEQLVGLNQKLNDLAAANRVSAASLIGRKVEGTAKDRDGVETRVAGLVAQVDYGEAGKLVLGLQDGTNLAFSDITAISQA